MANEGFEDAVAELHGLSQKQEERNNFVPKSCSKCGNESIAPIQRWCGRCGGPLDPDAVEEVEYDEKGSN
ncbi:MAG: XerD/XerC family integrase [Candidatus Methanohalarchaeum thermophilum]|uniref:XerD/XerC family integrase n=1 Tax=Methanohalarchaeum thermophilum TaxID=1903181 RepID=A0A1Q6DTT8_METT1|nr:MAG: XerD/XerC family integrase [Candidatus Methanohalarchaeum thermophilum]